MYGKIMKQLTIGIRLMTGIALLLVGVIWQMLSEKTLDMYAFYFMAAAMLCFVNVIIEKAANGTSDPARYLILNMIVLVVGFVLTGSDFATGMVMYCIWGLCLIADWVVNTVLISCDGMTKRIVMGFAAMFLNVLLIGVVFMVPVLVEAFGA